MERMGFVIDEDSPFVLRLDKLVKVSLQHPPFILLAFARIQWQHWQKIAGWGPGPGAGFSFSPGSMFDSGF